MKPKLYRVELTGNVQILKDAEQVDWKFLHITDEDGTIIEIDKAIVVKLFEHLVATQDKRVDVSGWTFVGEDK